MLGWAPRNTSRGSHGWSKGEIDLTVVRHPHVLWKGGIWRLLRERLRIPGFWNLQDSWFMFSPDVILCNSHCLAGSNPHSYLIKSVAYPRVVVVVVVVVASLLLPGELSI